MTETAFIAGKIFKTHEGRYEPGDVVPNAHTWPNFQALVDAGFLYLVVPDAGYGNLPAHIYSAVMSKREAQDKVRDSNSNLGAQAKAAHEAPAAAVEAKVVKDREAESHQKNRLVLRRRVEEAQNKRNEPLVTNESVANRLGSTPERTDSKQVEAARAAEEQQSPYAGKTKPELQELLKERGLPTSGNIPDLINRLEINDGEE